MNRLPNRIFITVVIALLALPLRAETPATTTIALDNVEDREVVQRLIDNMVVIPAGIFLMGDALKAGESDERPTRQVEVPAFAIGRYEVTFEQYDLYARLSGVSAPADRWGRGQRPVIDVTWADAQGFIEWLREVTQIPFRLPSEAEWEYAARAGSASLYFYGDDPAQFCEYGNIADSSTTIGWRNKQCEDGFKTTAPVGSFKPNALGLYDMYGNVWEWQQDCWFSNHRGAKKDASVRDKSSCSERVQRGGSWFSSPDEGRSTYRIQGKEDDKSVSVGFRLVHDAR